VDLQDLIGRRQIRLQQQLRLASPIETNRAKLGNVLGRTQTIMSAMPAPTR
jgi:hypothetical protein